MNASEIDGVIGGVERFSLMAQLRDMVVEAIGAQSKLCGSCERWMKSRECPREHNVNGMSRGPSMNERACPQFVEKRWHVEHRAKLIRDAVTFAKAHSLPMPAALSTPEPEK